MLSIQPQYLTLWNLLAGRLFRIAEYQRAYSWGSSQRSDLFNDIIKAYTKSNSTHFMSAVVALRRDKTIIVTDEFHITEIVDGQQRITTLILLLKAIELGLSRKNKIERKLAEEIQEILVKPDRASLLLLQTNHDTSHYFANYLRRGTHPEITDAVTLADKQLLLAINECEDFVEKWKSKHSLPELLALLKNRFAFILHEIDDEAAVYTVFEVLNSRGLEVSWFDRLKSILMGIAFELKAGNESEVIKELQRLWSDIYSCIGLRQGMNTESLRFAATLWHTYCPSRPLGEAESVESLRKKCKNAPALLGVAEHVLAVTKAVDKLWSDRRLNAVTKISQARLLATAIHLRTDFTKPQKAALLKKWECVTFRIYGMLRKDSRTGVGDYVRLAWNIFNQKFDYQNASAELDKIGVYFPIKDAVASLKEANCYEGWEEELRYFFHRYEEHLAAEQEQKFDNANWKKIWACKATDSIEHIWAQSNANEKQKHRLGNLVLLSPSLNSQLQDCKPAQKKAAYCKTGLLIAHEVADLLDTPWNGKAISAREAALLEWAEAEWAD